MLTNCISYLKYASMMLALSGLSMTPANAQFFHHLPFSGAANPQKYIDSLFGQAIGKALGKQLPLQLSAHDAYPTVSDAELPGGKFNGKPLEMTAANLLQPLPPGDYVVRVTAFCSEYSVHQPGAGTAYTLGPVEGRLGSAIAILLWRGSLAGRDPHEIQAVSWSIQAGVPYAKMPGQYQTEIDELLPEWKAQLEGDWLESIQGRYGETLNTAAKYQRTVAFVPGVGGAMSHVTIPSFDGLLAKMGEPGQLALQAEQQKSLLTANYASDQIRQQTLFQGQGTPLPPEPAVSGPWTVKISGIAYLRFKAVGGNLTPDNVLEIRILASPSANGATLAALMGLQAQPPVAPTPAPVAVVAANPSTATSSAPSVLCIRADGIIAYSIGRGAQALILVPSTTSEQRAQIIETLAHIAASAPHSQVAERY